MTAWEKVEIARNPKRKTSLDYIDEIFDEFMELHGDRNFKDLAGQIKFHLFSSPHIIQH